MGFSCLFPPFPVYQVQFPLMLMGLFIPIPADFPNPIPVTLPPPRENSRISYLVI